MAIAVFDSVVFELWCDGKTIDVTVIVLLRKTVKTSQTCTLISVFQSKSWSHLWPEMSTRRWVQICWDQFANDFVTANLNNILLHKNLRNGFNCQTQFDFRYDFSTSWSRLWIASNLSWLSDIELCSLWHKHELHLIITDLHFIDAKLVNII